MFLANDNNPSQVVISGTPEAVDAVIAGIKAKRGSKAKRQWRVSFTADRLLLHEEFEPVLSQVPFQNSSNTSSFQCRSLPPKPRQTSSRKRLRQQITGAVRWREISLALPEHGIDLGIEIGPGQVLTGLIKRTCKGLALWNVSDLNSIDNLLQAA